jgi:cytochrome c oxidase subunit 3
MQWFIFSEVMFFAAFFGALFYVRNISGPWLGGEGSGAMNHLLWEGFRFEWPLTTTPQQAVGGADNQSMANNGIFEGPTGLVHWNHIPLINTILLLSSSFTVHFAHLSLKNNKRKLFDLWLGISILLGLFFVTLQGVEYQEAYTELGLTLQSGIYGSTFFILTGFHGLHVTLGATMLLVQWLRSTIKGDFSAEDHFGFEAAAWYWHFVDVVWLGLFLFVYIF